MTSRIVEFFGYDPQDKSQAAETARSTRHCPFVQAQCSKTLNDRSISGACTLQAKTGAPVVCCPMRLYAGNYQALRDIADFAFGAGPPLTAADSDASGARIAVFGKRWGKELRLPNRSRSGGYFVDWILAHIGPDDELIDFVAVEVQSIDTTGTYRPERDAYLAKQEFSGGSTAGFNWENVNKRILPQIIYKGHVLRQEPLCRKGLFFVCPSPVYKKITERLGGTLRAYPPQPGALTIVWYDVGPHSVAGQPRSLSKAGQLTTTIDQVALAFTSPSNLPPPGVYERAIRAELR